MHQEEPVKETSPQVSHVVEFSNVEFRARGYQLEMLDQSLKGNVIVAVRRSQNDGSRKAHTKRRWIPGAVRLRCRQFELGWPAWTNQGFQSRIENSSGT
jgi:hypothetical protein